MHSDCVTGAIVSCANHDLMSRLSSTLCVSQLVIMSIHVKATIRVECRA